MFGYVKILKDELKIKDYNIYRAYYCGLCHELGKNHNQLVRLGLNYDLTFLAVLLDSVSEEKSEFCIKGCIKHIAKHKTLCSNPPLEYAADMNVLLAYFKLIDDIKDNRSVKAMIAVLPFMRRASAVKKKYPEVADSITLHLKRLKFLEDSGCDSVDKAAHEFAVIMSDIFGSWDKSLENFAYQLGRFIYTADAYDDMEEDFKKHRYNPAVRQYSYNGAYEPQMLTSMRNSLYYSLADISAEYEKMKITKNKEILDNIIYMGMRSTADRITCERKKEDEKSV